MRKRFRINKWKRQVLISIEKQIRAKTSPCKRSLRDGRIPSANGIQRLCSTMPSLCHMPGLVQAIQRSLASILICWKTPWKRMAWPKVLARWLTVTRLECHSYTNRQGPFHMWVKSTHILLPLATKPRSLFWHVQVPPDIAFHQWPFSIANSFGWKWQKVKCLDHFMAWLTIGGGTQSCLRSGSNTTS